VSLSTTAHPLLPEAERTLTPDQVKASEDVQFLHALNVLSTPVTKVGHLPG